MAKAGAGKAAVGGRRAPAREALCLRVGCSTAASCARLHFPRLVNHVRGCLVRKQGEDKSDFR